MLTAPVDGTIVGGVKDDSVVVVSGESSVLCWTGGPFGGVGVGVGVDVDNGVGIGVGVGVGNGADVAVSGASSVFWF